MAPDLCPASSKVPQCDGAPWPGALTHVFKAYYQLVSLPPYFLPLLPGFHINHLLQSPYLWSWFWKTQTGRN